jgi:micrococcal nuclease
MKSGLPLRDVFGRQWKLWLLALAAAVISLRIWEAARDRSRDFDFQSRGPYRVDRVEEDGTLILDRGIPLRLIGIAFGTNGKEAAAEAVEILRRDTKDRDLFLEFDRERRDRRGRILAYVTVDGLLLNEELIRSGCARIDVGVLIDTSMAGRFRRAQEEARLAERGIWHDESVTSR